MADIDLGKALKESIFGTKQEEIIKSGTLVVTRGIGVIAVAFVGTFYLLDQFGDAGPWTGLSTAQKLAFVVAAAAVWAIVAAADTVARGLATARSNDLVAMLPAGLKAKKTHNLDSAGWSVVAVKYSTGSGSEAPMYLLVKAGEPAEWLSSDKLAFG